MWQLIAIAATFTWLGMVLAISFLETPLKFQAPGITLPLGLGIGRIVFRALNIAEIALAIVVLGSVAILGTDPAGWILLGVVAAVLSVQLGMLRPRLDRRTQQMIAGRPVPSSRLHLSYIALECTKVATLMTLGAVLNAVP
ncbi:hypothetical protein SAMN04515671_3620 [Nakamurella panacisegetis]|uniref:Transmembrane protein n=1 Tax=Nakamurella panacisegetis TaxID=1090615 RepID=A0A1H0RKD7_9ACTN|nr:hypothetical protein [Nakamurella panacisegetis]SDP29905.1 hypothetical protein SAMN04515671_3620 [Nakamurella panacisegetis]